MNNKLVIKGHLFELFLEQHRIEARIAEMAKMYNQDLSAEKTMIPVMSGAFYFTSQFLQHIDKPYRLATVQTSSYRGVNQGDQIDISYRKDEGLIRDRGLVILEDIVDSGRTASELENYFYALGAADVEVVSLFYKPDKHKYPCNLVSYGFSVGSEFLVGYGLDLDEEGRYMKNVFRLVGNEGNF